MKCLYVQYPDLEKIHHSIFWFYNLGREILYTNMRIVCNGHYTLVQLSMAVDQDVKPG